MTVTFEIPDDVRAFSHQTPEEVAHDLLIAAVVKWYECGKLSQGRAAEIARVSRSEFLDILSKFKVSIWQYTRAEIEEDLANAR